MNKSTLVPVKIAAAQSMAANFSTAPTDIRYQDNITYQVNVTSGTGIGVMDVEVSSDYNPLTSNAGNWTALGVAYRAVIDGTGVGVFDLNQLGPCYSRLTYTRTSGTGAMDIYVSGKQV